MAAKKVSAPQQSWQPSSKQTKQKTDEAVQAKSPDAQTQGGVNLPYGAGRENILRSPAPNNPPNLFQAQLTIGAVGDKYEQEADAVARQVVNQLQSSSAGTEGDDDLVQQKSLRTTPIQRIVLQADGLGGGTVSPDFEQRLNQAKGGGQSLPTQTQSQIGGAMGADFSQVQVHTGSAAQQLTSEVQAKAFTTGSDVFFNQGQYQPGNRGGQELIAHELTHVVQQGAAASVQRKPKIPSIQRIVFEDDDTTPINNLPKLVTRLTKELNIDRNKVKESAIFQLYVGPSGENTTFSVLVQKMREELTSSSKSKAKSESEPEVKSTSKSELEPEVKSTSKSESKPEPEVKSTSKSESKSEPKSEPKSMEKMLEHHRQMLGIDGSGEVDEFIDLKDIPGYKEDYDHEPPVKEKEFTPILDTISKEPKISSKEDLDLDLEAPDLSELKKVLKETVTVLTAPPKEDVKSEKEDSSEDDKYIEALMQKPMRKRGKKISKGTSLPELTKDPSSKEISEPLSPDELAKTKLMTDEGHKIIKERLLLFKKESKVGLLGGLSSKGTFSPSFGKRGRYTKAIDNWCNALDDASMEQRVFYMKQLYDSCNAWVKHHSKKKSMFQHEVTVIARLSSVRRLRKCAHVVLTQHYPDIKLDDKASFFDSSESLESKDLEGTGVLEDVSGIPTESGVTGDYSDIGVDKHHNSSDVDVAEGTNVLAGIAAFQSADNPVDKAAAVGQSMHGFGKLAKGILIKVKDVESSSPEDDKKAYAAYMDYTAIGDVGAGMADLTGCIAETFHLIETLQKGKGIGPEEALDMTQKAGKAMLAGMHTVKDTFKAYREFANVETLGSAVSTMATIGGIASAVLGTIELVQLIVSCTEAKKLNTVIKSGLENLNKHKEKLTESGLALKSALVAQEKINNLVMDKKDVTFKAATAVTGIVSGILVASGVGAPIAIAIGVLGGIIGLGYSGMKWRRNKQAAKVVGIAERLTPTGDPKGKPDEDIAYREAETRTYNCYYNHLDEVIKRTPKLPGMSESDFASVKFFTLEDKMKNAPKESTTPVDSITKVNSVGRSDKETKWVTVTGTETQTEYPTSKELKKLGRTFSAHKSSQAKEANIKDIVDAVYVIGSNSYLEEENTFRPTPVIPTGAAGEDKLSRDASNPTDAVALMDMLKIKPKHWQKWLTSANKKAKNPDAVAVLMKKSIKSFVS